ncbi:MULTISPECIES: flagellar biosynthesis anti-sigma factor FlgM [unclassified Oceanispirochaeta]|uniref:flagellar biosynthesis anti-sigma factor FlgM n=1 Tax=unclassified Oceanispirochaeta TaxID=2635722 RepID=UPI000E090F06|nr:MULTISPECIES: flagellar biosynthesis anti-sigma factor FlgM [unclassified Oceanispirochaeta]MBF9015386.1 flagellar biosynthesis anti-sigma factor FlgM [Oceanispirochaeta sp. M2]NPD71845.1 flagellar biosynthesis anti-sigma factor FlgM [Oceanispirochaeta sp. M1]RDG32655.1 flagellar biosynthesis anti-sigma factor FlgM [Oceanispirochaeta sp. M1]
MTIDRIGPVDPLSRFNKTEKAVRSELKEKSDSIDVSSEAKKSAELLQTMESVKLAPDVREDRIAEVKARLQDPNYINDTVVNSVADKLMDLFGI